MKAFTFWVSVLRDCSSWELTKASSEAVSRAPFGLKL